MLYGTIEHEMADSLDDVERQNLGTSPEEWLGSPDPVAHFRALLDRALQELSREVAGIRAERDGLRLELEGLRVQFDRVRAQLDDRDRFESTVRELHEIVRVLNIQPAVEPEPAPLTEPVTEPAAVERPRRTRRKRRGGWLRKALTGASIAAGVVVLVVILLVSVGPKIAPYETYFVKSGSMEPTFARGDLIVLGKVDASDIHKGDIITFERPDTHGTLVTHRVVGVETVNGVRQFETKGDANPAPDAWRVPITGKAWRYRFRVPKIGYLFSWLSTTVVRIVMLAIPAAILALLAISDGRKPKTSDEAE